MSKDIHKPEQLITEHIDIWTSAILAKSSSGRGSSKKYELYGITKLRELILELAVRGKLVPQDTNDEPASVLLEKIAAEKARLIKEKLIKKTKPLSIINNDEKYFELPEGWQWVRLGTIFNSIISGGTPSKNESLYWGGDIPWASVKDLGKDKYILKTQDYITKKGLDAGSKLASENDIIICTRMGIGKIGIAKVPLAFNQDLKAVKLNSYISTDYFLNTYASLKIEGTGTTVKGITQEQLLNYVIALPPSVEQHRIVAKVDELMLLCDQLEQQTEASIEAHATLVEVLLATLIDSKDADELAQNWARVSEHFDSLFTTEQSIEALKQTVLQLAVMGKLVPQDPNDEPASVLLEKIAEEKEQLVKDKVIKKEKPLPAITDEEKPFELPQGWTFCRLIDLVTILGDGLHGTPKYTENGEYYFINGNNLNNGNIEIKPHTKKVSQDEYLRYKKPLCKSSVLVSINGTLGNVGFYNDEPVVLGKSACYFNLTNNTSKKYIKRLLESDIFLNYADITSTGSTIRNLGLKAMRMFPIALPSLAEQHRIVAKVDELMAICDQLKEKLQQSQETQVQLTDALIDRALG